VTSVPATTIPNQGSLPPGYNPDKGYVDTLPTGRPERACSRKPIGSSADVRLVVPGPTLCAPCPSTR